jgi:hypothetical protein
MLWRSVTRRYPALRRFGGGRAGAKPRMTVYTCTLFYSYFRLHARIETGPPSATAAPPSVRLLMDGTAPMQQTDCRRLDDGLAHEIFVNALIDPARFPGDGCVEMTLGGKVETLTIDELLLAAKIENSGSLFDPFKAEIAAWCVAHAPARPALLEIGRGVQLSERFPECDVTSFDIVPGAGVNVVGDAHELSRHFPPARFDFAQSISVFEHLVMPWQVAVELNRVLKPGGVAHIVTHQTTGMRDAHRDFFRFSDASFAGLFNRYTGFEILRAQMSNPMYIVPRAWSEHYRDNEGAVGFDCSAALVRKIGDATVSWDVPVADILNADSPHGAA